MAGTFPRPLTKAVSTATEFGRLAALVADAALTETTTGHREDGFQGGEPAEPDEFNYLMQRIYRHLLRNAVTLVAEHRAMTATIGGAVTIGDTRRLTVSSPVAFTVDYVTDAGDTTNDDIASGFAAAINTHATASLYVWASAAGAVVTVEWLVGGLSVTFTAATTVGAGTTVAAQLNADASLFYRPADDDTYNGRGLLIGSSSTEDLASGTVGDARMFYAPQQSAFRAGEVDGTQWNAGSRGNFSSALGRNVTASGAYALSLGRDCTASGASSAAIGRTAVASAEGAVSIGRDVDASAANAVAIGQDCVASAANATSIGVGETGVQDNEAAGARSVAIGYRNAAGGDESTCIGDDNSTGGAATEAVAIGAHNEVDGSGAVAIGSSNAVTGTAAQALGSGNEAAGDNSTALGTDCVTSADKSTAIGFRASAAILGAVAINSGSPVLEPAGSRQRIMLTAYRDTTNATPAELQVQGQASQIVVPNGSTITGRFDVAAYCTGGAGGNVNKGFGAVGVFTARCNAAGAMQVLGSTITAHDGETVGYAVTIDVATANTLKIMGAGAATDDVSWVASIDYAIVTP